MARRSFGAKLGRIDRSRFFSVARRELAAHGRSLVPWRRFTLDAPWPPDALAGSLAGLISEGRMGAGWQLAQTRRGVRLCRYAVRLRRLHAIVIASVSVSPTQNGCRLLVTVRSPASAIAFFVYFAASAVAGGVALCASAFARGDATSLLVCLLFACLMPVVAWGIVAVQLVPEVCAAERALRSAVPSLPPETGPFR